MAKHGVVTLPDRRIPGTRAIDDITIAPSGVYVIGAKYREKGEVEKRSIIYRHVDCGGEVEQQLVCGQCGIVIEEEKLGVEIGPGMAGTA